MVPSLNLSSIIYKWRDALQASASIQTYCTAKYSKKPKIFIGINGQNPPEEADCPMIILYPGAKSEGLELQEYTYKLTVGWTVFQEAVPTNNGITEYLGIVESDDLGQLIYLELAGLSTDNPISVVNYSLEPISYYPHFHGRMDITLKITPVNGYNIHY